MDSDDFDDYDEPNDIDDFDDINGIFDGAILDNDDVRDFLANIAPRVRRQPQPPKVKKPIKPQKTEEKKKENDKEKKKESKWGKVARKLKTKGLLQNNKNNFIDYVTFDLNLPARPTNIVTKELSCGYFDWTFSFFFNDDNNSKKFFKFRPSNVKGNKYLKKKKFKNFKNSKSIGGVLRNVKKKRISLAGEYRSGNARRFVEWKKKKSYLLFAECHPNPIFSVDLHGQDIHEWGLISSFRIIWKGSKRDNEQIFGKRMPCAFTSLLPAAPIRSYGGKRFRKSQTLIVHLWVNKINKLGLVPHITFDKELENNLSVCLRCDKEYFHVNKAKLAMYSMVFRHNIFNDKLGTDLNNPIKIDKKFDPSIVRLALRFIFNYNTRIPCPTVNELLEFAYEYKILAILNNIEESLINRRNCKHFNYQQKIELAYKYELDDLKNNFCKLNNSFELIEKNLKNENLDSEFKEQLKRKLACMKAAEAVGKERIKTKDEERAKKRKASRMNKKAKKAALQVEKNSKNVEDNIAKT